MRLILKRSYGGVCLMTSIMMGEYFLYKHMEYMQRQATYDNEFIEYHFSEIHHLEIGDDTARLGYPDDGNGRYTKQKMYPDWYFMNIVKRQSSNNLENIVLVAPFSLVNGMFLPYPTIALLSTYIVGRYFYNDGYLEKEGVKNQKRMIGAVMSHLSTFSTLFISLYIGK